MIDKINGNTMNKTEVEYRIAFLRVLELYERLTEIMADKEQKQALESDWIYEQLKKAIEGTD